MYPCSFNYFLIDYDSKNEASGYINIIANPKINKNGRVSKIDRDNVYELEKIYIINDFKVVFAGLIETIYQIRNLIIHGNVKPEKDEHEVVKYCYLILHDLL